MSKILNYPWQFPYIVWGKFPWPAAIEYQLCDSRSRDQQCRLVTETCSLGTWPHRQHMRNGHCPRLFELCGKMACDFYCAGIFQPFQTKAVLMFGGWANKLLTMYTFPTSRSQQLAMRDLRDQWCLRDTHFAVHPCLPQSLFETPAPAVCCIFFMKSIYHTDSSHHSSFFQAGGNF